MVGTENKRINYKSDFDFILSVRAANAQGEVVDVGFPTYDFIGTLYTRGLRKFSFSQKDGVQTNCFNDNGKLHVVANAHNLYSGILRIDFQADIPNTIYPDGLKLTVTDCPIGIELVNGCSDEISDVEAAIIAPYIKGEKGDKGDKGDKGEQGVQGIQGIQGIQGEKGDKGDALTWDSMTDEQQKAVVNMAVEEIQNEQITTLAPTDNDSEYNDVF